MQAASSRPSFSIARRYATQVAAIAAALLIASGGVEMYFSFQEARQDMARLQAAQATAAAREIEQYLQGIKAGLNQVARLPWGERGFGPAQKREEFHRLMALFPSVMELRDLSAAGRELVFVSRTELDRIAAPAPLEAAPAIAPALGFGATQFRGGAEPFVSLTLASAAAGDKQARTQASINLRFLADVVSGLRVGRLGQTYVVDAADRLVAHPKATQVLRQLDLSHSHAVMAARQALAKQGQGQDQGFGALDTFDVEGRPVIATVAALASVPGWLVFVEQPRSEALEAAFATLRRTLLLFGVGGGLAVLAAALYARRLARPIVELRRAAGQIAAGDLGSRIALSSGDELELLANDFNLMAAKLQASYAGLEAQVEARTHELQLAKTEAERANLAKTRFLAAASHDLRQPLHTIGLLVSLLRERLKGREALELADKVYRSVDTLEALFGGLLDISKLDAGAILARPESFAVDELLAHLEHSYAAQAEARGLRLRLRRCGALVRSDPALLERIVGNLISNAIRYTDSGGVLLLCRMRGSGDGARALAIQVWDSGCGIDPAQWADIFDEFYRIEEPGGKAGHESEQGLGLGLAIVKRTAQLLCHPLRLCSRPGRGSMFELRVPLVPLVGGSMVSAARLGLPLGQPGGLAGSFVVIVDDDRDNREALDALCSQWGMHTLSAASLEQACEQVTRHLRVPDLIISDFNVGAQGDGCDVILRLRELLGEQVPAIIVTADTGDGARQRAWACGAALFSKPANAERLLEGIRGAIAAGAQAAAAAAASDAVQAD
ncbi:MAG: response regulator [Paucibacter sp.]|nr:response regulator [Roseateles sp.]